MLFFLVGFSKIMKKIANRLSINVNYYCQSAVISDILRNIESNAKFTYECPS